MLLVAVVQLFAPVPIWVQLVSSCVYLATPLGDGVITLVFVKPYQQAWFRFWGCQGANPVAPATAVSYTARGSAKSVTIRNY